MDPSIFIVAKGGQGTKMVSAILQQAGNKHSSFSLILMFVVSHACAQKDPATGMLNQTFRTPYTTQHKMGGVIPVKKIQKNTRSDINIQNFGSLESIENIESIKY